MCGRNREFGARVRPAAAAGPGVSGPVPESDSSHLRRTPMRAVEDLDTGLQCPELFREERIRGQLERHYPMGL